jgi:carboxyl-terminal processing protease
MEALMQSSGVILRAIIVLFIIALVGMSGFGAGIALERYVIGPGLSNGSGADRVISSIDRDTVETNEVDIELIEEVLRILEEEYYYGPVDRQEAIYDALEGLVGGLPDQYSVFLRPIETRMSRQQLSGEYEGIGVWVDQPEGRLTIIAPMRGSPAERAGLRAGDVITEVDGVSIEGMTIDDAVRRVRGPEGTSVNLTIERPGVEETLQFTVERARIEMPAVMYELREDNVALVTVTILGDKTIEQLDDAIMQARADDAVGIVLDLRSNGGGWVTTSQEMVGRFVPVERGPALYERKDPEEQNPTAMPIIAGDVAEFDLPLVVLVNGSTASAAEIVAGALQDYNRATVIGTPTLGKGSIQRIHQFDDGSSVRVTIAEWLTPNQTSIQDRGIDPDILFELPDDEAAPDEDDELVRRAIEYLTDQD